MLKTGPCWSIFFLFFFVFLFLKISFSLQKEEDFSKTWRKRNKQYPSLALKIGPILLRNILGPVFTASLDQFLTLGFFLFLFVFFFCLAETPYFLVFSAKNTKFKETQKRKKTLFVSTPVLSALVKMSFFFCIFHSWFFFAISKRFRDVFDRFQKMKT